MNLKKISKFILFLLPWFISIILFKIDKNYYFNLNKPFFSPQPIVFAIIWPILYLLISYSAYSIWNKSDNNYKIGLGINYLSNQLFTFFLFSLKSLSLSLIDTIIILLSSIYLYFKTKEYEKNKSKLLIPYIIWNSFAFILILFITIMN